MHAFKEFDKKYTTGADSDLPSSELVEALKITRWTYPVRQWSQQEVKEAVYEADGYEDWQKFRVSLKGQSTQVKLHRLAARRQAATQMSPRNRTLEMCRIDNYIGALKRGGQLGMDLEVRR